MENEKHLNQKRFSELTKHKAVLQFINTAKQQLTGQFGDCDKLFTFTNDTDLEDVNAVVGAYVEREQPQVQPTDQAIDEAVKYMTNTIDIIESEYNCLVLYPYAPIGKIDEALVLLNTYLDETITSGERQELEIDIKNNTFAKKVIN